MWFLPSRGRPESLVRFFDAFVETGATTPGVVRVDHDDPRFNEYLYSLNMPSNWCLMAGDRQSMSEMYNDFFNDYRGAPW